MCIVQAEEMNQANFLIDLIDVYLLLYFYCATNVNMPFEIWRIPLENLVIRHSTDSLSLLLSHTQTHSLSLSLYVCDWMTMANIPFSNNAVIGQTVSLIDGRWKDWSVSQPVCPKICIDNWRTWSSLELFLKSNCNYREIYNIILMNVHFQIRSISITDLFSQSFRSSFHFTTIMVRFSNTF